MLEIHPLAILWLLLMTFRFSSTSQTFLIVYIRQGFVVLYDSPSVSSPVCGTGSRVLFKFGWCVKCPGWTKDKENEEEVASSARSTPKGALPPGRPSG